MVALTCAMRETLSACVLFENASDALIDAALSTEGVELRYFEAGSVIFSPLEEAHMLGVVLQGRAQVYKPSENAQSEYVVMSVLTAGDVYGAATLFAKKPPKTKIVAKKPLTALCFSEEAFVKLMQRDFGLTRAYCAYLTGRIRFLTERLDCLAGATVADKLMSYFVKNAMNGVVKLPYGMESLAKAVSVSRASLYRALDDMERAGLITRDGREIRLLEINNRKGLL